MTKRDYPHITREKYRGRAPGRCACCGLDPTWTSTIQLSIFRGDDDVYDLCDAHMMLARSDYEAFMGSVTARRSYMSERVTAKHEETGRVWSGERRALPPRYQVVARSESDA